MSAPKTSAEIREAYLKFFESKGCQRWASSSLVPDDPSLLLTVAGMVQFKPYFLQQKHIDSRYIGTTTSQKCVRTNDIDLIGTDGRHLSFFEMLGNFSFGEYFKKEMCAWAWEFSTEILCLDPQRIYVTVFLDDDEAAQIWEEVGVHPSHISRLGEEDNFWTAGPTGPCGPCSEMYYDQGEEVGCGKKDCKPGCDCDRFLEYWNLVFTQFDRQEDGTLVALEKKNIDTGMGLERAAAIMQGVTSNFDTDILRALVGVGEKLTGTKYGVDEKTDLSLRIMADHTRAITFMLGDGILPSNEGRGYVLRRLLRRAVRHGHILGIDKPFLNEFLSVIVELMGQEFREIIENRTLIEQTMLSEEERFRQTISNGEHYLMQAIESLNEGDTLDGVSAFKLHDTFGFPFELTVEICAENGILVDKSGFEVEMENQRQRARSARKDDAWSEIGDVYTSILDKQGEPEFVGYRFVETDAIVKAIIVDGQSVDSAQAGAKCSIILNKTPFYGEMGGQVGDTGVITTDTLEISVDDTQKPEAGLPVHMCTIKEGIVKVGDEVHATIDAKRRARIARNHTATHILQKALSVVLGDHVKQAGSVVHPDRFRFDFTHFEAMTPNQIKEVEQLCNKVIMSDLPVHTYETSLTAARESGVLALFGEKYGQFVRVVEVGNFSRELCGGTHAGRSSEIGLLKIVQETSIGSNTRRIEAVTSFDAFEYMSKREDALDEVAHIIGCTQLDTPLRVTALMKRNSELEAESKRQKKMNAANDVSALINEAKCADGYKVIIANLHDNDIEGMRQAWDVVKAKAAGEAFAIVFAACNPESKKPLLLCAGTDASVEAGFNAGEIVKNVTKYIKGGGGGKPNMAQAGGSDACGIEDMLKAASTFLGV